MNEKKRGLAVRFLLGSMATLGLMLSVAGSIAQAEDTTSYIIRVGDTLMTIAQDHDTTVEQLQTLNPQLTGNYNIYVGQIIQVPIHEPEGEAFSPATANSTSRLRGGPGTTYDIAGRVAQGTALEVVGRNLAGDWLWLARGAWIAAFLVDNVPDDLPVVETPTIVVTPSELTTAYNTDYYAALARFTQNVIELAGVGIVSRTRNRGFDVIYPLPGAESLEIECEEIAYEEFTRKGIKVGTQMHSLTGRAGRYSSSPQLDLDECQWHEPGTKDNVPDDLPVVETPTIVVTPSELTTAYNTDYYAALARFTQNVIELAGVGIVSRTRNRGFDVIYPLPGAESLEIECEEIAYEEFTRKGIKVGTQMHSLTGRAGRYSSSPQLDLDECQWHEPGTKDNVSDDLPVVETPTIVVTPSELTTAYNTDYYAALARFTQNVIELAGVGIVSRTRNRGFDVIYPLPGAESLEIECEEIAYEKFTGKGIKVGTRVHSLTGRAGAYYGNPKLNLDECQFTFAD